MGGRVSIDEATDDPVLEDSRQVLPQPFGRLRGAFRDRAQHVQQLGRGDLRQGDSSNSRKDILLQTAPNIVSMGRCDLSPSQLQPLPGYTLKGGYVLLTRGKATLHAATDFLCHTSGLSKPDLHAILSQTDSGSFLLRLPLAAGGSATGIEDTAATWVHEDV